MMSTNFCHYFSDSRRTNSITGNNCCLRISADTISQCDRKSVTGIIASFIFVDPFEITRASQSSNYSDADRVI